MTELLRRAQDPQKERTSCRILAREKNATFNRWQVLGMADDFLSYNTGFGQ